jgi:hypothetical protein
MPDPVHAAVMGHHDLSENAVMAIHPPKAATASR